LPIPVSVLACYFGILLLGTYKRAFISFSFIFLTCVLMMMSAIILTQGQPAEQQAKFILLIQFILPMIALVLGQVFEPLKIGNDSAICAKAFFWVLLTVVPIQLFFTWDLALGYLSPRVGFFSIYQYLQYVPVIFVSAYLISVFNLWSEFKYKVLIVGFCPFMAIYSAASLSMLALLLLLCGLLAFALYKVKNEKLPLAVFLLTLICAIGYLQLAKDKPMVSHKFGLIIHLFHYIAYAGNSGVHSAEKVVSAGGVTKDQYAHETSGVPEIAQVPAAVTQSTEGLPNFVARSAYWQYYADKVTTNVETFLLGIAEPPKRSQYPSAHNYYLDFIYNFGMLALLPMLCLIAYTILMIARNARTIWHSPSLLGLCIVVLFILIVDNTLKVGLRQPYPAIFTFFLWGLLLTKLSTLTNRKNHVST